jgi:hypothetical protein
VGSHVEGELHVGAIDLAEREVCIGQRRLTEVVVLAIGSDADDGKPISPTVDLSANRETAGEEAANKLLVDDHDWR